MRTRPPSSLVLFVLNWCIAILIVGVVLPLLMVAGALAVFESAVEGAISHGELFLAGGNATVTSSAVLMATRYDRPVNAAAAALAALLLIGVPSYGFWALLSAQVLLNRPYSVDFAVAGGTASAAVGLLVSCVFIWFASTRPAS